MLYVGRDDPGAPCESSDSSLEIISNLFFCELLVLEALLHSKTMYKKQGFELLILSSVFCVLCSLVCGQSLLYAII